MDGEWTVSFKGLPFSNLAVDEAHESVFNRRMKAFTSRPSAFRTVELADFMSYLDTILVGFECYVLQNNSTPKQHYKMYVSQRVPIIRQLIIKIYDWGLNMMSKYCSIGMLYFYLPFISLSIILLKVIKIIL